MKRRLHWYSEGLESGEKPKAGILFLPGRGGHGVSMMDTYKDVFIWNDTALMSLTPLPSQFGWYPMPNGPEDQHLSVQGLVHAKNALNKVLDDIEEMYGLPREKILLSGFSAGAVVALHHHTTTDRPCAGVISHGGAILEPKKVGKATHRNPVLLNHSQDDFCFDWFERYLPMKNALIKKGYLVWLAERSKGNHTLLRQDVDRCQGFFEKTLDITLKVATPESWDDYDLPLLDKDDNDSGGDDLESYEKWFTDKSS